MEDKITGDTTRFAEAVQRVFGAFRRTKTSQQRQEQRSRSNTADMAMIRAFANQIRHNTIAGYRRNTRGLPVGFSVSEYNNAVYVRKLVNRRGKTDDDSPLSETRINGADTVLEAVKHNNATRIKYRRPSKIARRVCKYRGLTIKQHMARQTAKMRANRAENRIPYQRSTT